MYFQPFNLNYGISPHLKNHNKLNQDEAIPYSLYQNKTIPYSLEQDEIIPYSLEKGKSHALNENTAGSLNKENPAIEINLAEKRVIEQLKGRDAEVRAHEHAHLAAAGGAATGGPKYVYVRGPDGRLYAVGGEVSITAAYVPGNPEKTIEKAQKIRRAALAPANPSAQDMRVAAAAMGMERQARIELSRERSGEKAGEMQEQGKTRVSNWQGNTLYPRIEDIYPRIEDIYPRIEDIYTKEAAGKAESLNQYIDILV